ncbi:hypothetical protein GGS23DRAFT_608496 [Durotheca rogersii]|uniref:uncharacterized protein n=1 Tax=Durotheca rogersii TaxID=419775 RepID=UPI00221EDD86|nr:uncharacterized protein GGS23DRAFT_608496 [Durotheca rogersii]KAI5867926.1 hypothetical protein GGS23DRAFT_608496 [Durotheca rogersii]
MESGDAAHEAAVAAIAARVREFYERRAPFQVYHGGTHSTRGQHKTRGDTVDTSGLRRVLGIDGPRQVALVEPNVTMGALVAAAAERDLVPVVVPGFPGITVGGAFSGTSLESSSCRHGPFDAAVARVELVLADGSVRAADQDHASPDLFWAAASAFGTLAVVTLLEVRLRPARPFVRLAHTPAASFADANRLLRDAVLEPAIDFVDAIAFAPDSIVVCTGIIVDALPRDASQDGFGGDGAAAAPGKKKEKNNKVQPRRYLGRWDPWFYLDVRERVARPGRAVVDFVPLVDYLFRWERGAFWIGRHVFSYFWAPFNRLTRAALDSCLRPRLMYPALHASRLADAYVIQDAAVPWYVGGTEADADGADEELFRWAGAELGIYPMWLCPIRVYRNGPDAAHGLHAAFADPSRAMFRLNIGIRGPPRPRPSPESPSSSSSSSSAVRNVAQADRALERKLLTLRGQKLLYARVHYSEAEFWSVYDRPTYDADRVRYHADHLPSVYDKVRTRDGDAGEAKDEKTSWMPRALRKARPFQGLYGVYKAWRGSDYVLKPEKPASPKRF